MGEIIYSKKIIIQLFYGVLCTPFIFCADYNGWRYFGQYSTNWWAANGHCQGMNGDLWKPRANMWSWVPSFITSIGGGSVWIGAHDQHSEGSWMWIDGSVVQGRESKWWPGEPNDLDGEDCVTASVEGWNDEGCGKNFNFACQWPICGGRTILNRACMVIVTNDTIYYRGGSTRNHGGGTCASPENCINCQDGFYANQGFCTICPQIANCNHRRCSNPGDNYCEWCQYEIVDKQYWRAYTRHKDGHMKECRKTCSWRSDSTRCYPGNCTDEVAQSCVCTDGFGGNHCDTITEETSVLYAEIKLHTATNEILTTPKDPNDPGNEPTKWTNNKNFGEAEVEIRAKYVASGYSTTGTPPPQPDPNGVTHYITDFNHGIIYGLITVDYIRGNPNANNTFLQFSCPGNEDSPINVNYDCSRLRHNNSQVILPTFYHSDQLVFSIVVKNGGFLKYMNRESNTEIRSPLNGITSRRSYIIQWDYIQPFHTCLNAFGVNCTIPPLELKDATNASTISLTWRQWSDGLAGIEYYQYELYELQYDGSSLKENNILYTSDRIPHNHSQSEFNVTTPGMYSIIFTVFDKAGNHKSTRSVFLFDDESVVETTPGTRIIVTESTVNTNYTWVVQNMTHLHVSWTERFTNERHHVRHWLEQLAPNKHVDELYDDKFGVRKVDWFTNVLGVVKFDVDYTVTGPDVTSFLEYKNVDDILQELEELEVIWEDGQRLDISVKATDIVWEYKEESITVYKDTSQPIIENLWLSRDSKEALYVHHIEDFSKMTIEWDTFDYHSGIDSVHWRLYDNFTGSDILHGQSHLIAQGQTENITACEWKYGGFPRGSDCYCTLYHGCFHRHFHVQPKIVNGSGLTPGKDNGVHDSDYFITVTVINQAMLKTVLTKKITIDTSAPQPGIVHDGLPDFPEIDYQQNLQLHVYWDGFFDPESGVKYYKYVFSDHCWERKDLINASLGIETFNTFASFTASKEGKYYVSVVAFNRANEASSLVCSDGVTISSSVPYVVDIVVKDLRTIPRLIEDKNNNIWYLDGSLRRHLVNNSKNACSSSSSLIDDIDIYPKSMITAIDCESLADQSSSFLSILPRISQLLISWKSGIDDVLVYDYEVGLSTTKGSAAPDIVPFKSTKHHNHFRLNNPDLDEGKLFYVIIKALSKTGVEGMQSIGPIIIDASSPRVDNSRIDVKLENEVFVANWSGILFVDEEDPYPLTYEYAIGRLKYGTDILDFSPLSFRKSCHQSKPPICTAIEARYLPWSLHADHEYYITIKVTNLAGLTATHTSEPYKHYTQMPVPGVVFDVNKASITDKLKETHDIDFTDVVDTFSLAWRGFYHPHLLLEYKLCVGTIPESCDIAETNNVDASSTSYTFDNLLLNQSETYYASVEAISIKGSVVISSDGVTVLDTSTPVIGIIIKDGFNCSDKLTLKSSHHILDPVPQCDEDTDFQSSTTMLGAYWSIKSTSNTFIKHAFWGVDEKSPVGDYWTEFLDFTYIGNHHRMTIGNLNLEPGLTYRIKVKLCADDICFPIMYSNGVTIIPNTPVTGGLSVTLETHKMSVTCARMYDPDLEDTQEAFDAIEKYEWTLIDGNSGGMYVKWQKVNNSKIINDTHFSFDIQLSDDISLYKCKRISVKGSNKVGIASEVSTDIKLCDVVDGPRQIHPKLVIDAHGEKDTSSAAETQGMRIHLETNTEWDFLDIDYTPYTNIISAVWPTLRHGLYTWGVIQVKVNYADRYYKSFTDMAIQDPCSHPDVVSCGKTDEQYINVIFNKTNSLQHGHRYIVCIHAKKSEIKYEKWTETLEEVNDCSDGVTVDLTPPSSGQVWVGNNPNSNYQTSSSDISITWDSFIDVEEHDKSMHSTGISKYVVSVGSTENGIDVIDSVDVGITNHVSFHGLNLQNGHEYFVKLTAFDFLDRSTTVNASPVTVDRTPPDTTGMSIIINGRHITNASEINTCWTGVFEDPESGIDYYEWGVGSKAGQDDVIPFHISLQDCASSAEDSTHELINGHSYFISVKSFNKAGMMTIASSWAYIFDMSPPVAGHVYDGMKDTSPSDIDYQTDMSSISVHWEGFHDPHTVIKNYFVHIGTCSGCNNVMEQQYNGAQSEFTLSHIHLISGETYFSTVVACNTANLCTSVASDGVVIDNSPPTVGIVQDGTTDDDIEYQSVRNYISAKWFGFTDAQSSIDHFVVRAGSSPGTSDIITPTKLPFTDIFLMTDVQLPLEKRIYITIRAYNKVGLFSESTSNGFKIDLSAPVIIVSPFLSHDLGSAEEGSVQVRSTMRIKWNVEDEQSFIERQYLSIGTHIGGEFNMTSTQLNGITTEYTMTGLELHDGGIYIIKLIVCNGAKICVETDSNNILVDTSPPVAGMFAISTYHAAELERHTSGWMTWSDYRLNMSWLGFSDIHSGISSYHVSVGSEFMANDLNKVPGTPMMFTHNESGIQYKDEGPLQYFTVPTQKLTKYAEIFVSVWAVNQVGLWSSMIHSQFQLIPGGFLDLIRRCSAHTCIGHCVCSPRNSHCALNGDACNDISKVNSNTLLEVVDITDLTSSTQTKFTPSNTNLAAKWKISKNQGLQPQWYEWSVGLASMEMPEGVINSFIDPIWHHVGHSMEAVYSLPKGNNLKETVAYSVFVRVWYDKNKFAIFKSPGITVLSKQVPVNDLQGAAVVEKVPGFWKNDADFIKAGTLFTVSWENVFLSIPNSVEQFNLYLSSFPGGCDLHIVDVNIPSSSLAFNISRLMMKPGVHYYSNIVVSTLSGLRTTVSSDGITVDISAPVTGLVYDGIGLHDNAYQNKSDIVSANWHGFLDTESGLSRYRWCVGTTQSDDICDVLYWENVGMHTSVSKQLTTEIENGNTVYSKVYAVDSVGHMSPIIVSSGVTIDTTPPVPVSFNHSSNNLVHNPSFEETNGCFLDFSNISSKLLCTTDACLQPKSWHGNKDDCTVLIRSDVDTAYDGRSFCFVHGNVKQNVSGLIPGEIYRLTFVAGHSPLSESAVPNIEGVVKLGDIEHIFPIFTKDQTHGVISPGVIWHKHSFYFKAKSEILEVVLGSLDRNTGLLIDDVVIQQLLPLYSGNKVHVTTVALHQWSSIHASWLFEDTESPIVQYLWAVGYTEGSTEIQDFTSVGVNTFGFNYNVTLVHSTTIYVTVVAINAAGLSSQLHSIDFLVDLTPPEIGYVNDGTGSDVDGQVSHTISANWNVVDEESGIAYCEWAAGLQVFGNEVFEFTKTADAMKATSTMEREKVLNKKIYITIRCRNTAGLYTTACSDGIVISDQSPSALNAELEILPQSITEYQPSNVHQASETFVKMKWSGFSDPFGIMSFIVKFDGKDTDITTTILNVNKDISYLSLFGLKLSDVRYTATVNAVNTMYLRSTDVTTNLTIQNSASLLTGADASITRKGDKITVNWKDCFSYQGRMVFEISIGTTIGGADIIQWQETLNDYIEVEVPEKFKDDNDVKLFFYIRAIGESGENTSLNTAL
ncbi:uncharacterized protein LOC127731085 [Mytilus californianus]|uniref:uncharacterized protein LOC127731085 n=1 Tax=Mytilus californianus TaxID=6549 RepID=UPI00224833FA|nr:uncharacterized protein LOC127731085 [Mytilus californianus]